MSTFFSHLECSVPCGAGPFDPRMRYQLCSCGAPLLARYDLTAAKRWPRASLNGRDATLWRYREILPLLEGESGLDQPITLGEGWTPLLRVRQLGTSLGLERLYIKDESANPTGSLKSRGMATATTRAFHLGLRTMTIVSSGSAAPALAAYASRGGLDARLFMAKDARQAFVRECELAGASVTFLDGGATEVAGHASDLTAASTSYNVSGFREPYRLEGEKTLGYELAEQLGWQLPDWIVCPVGEGTAIVALWKAFGELSALGWIDPVRRPHLVCVQAAGCAPLVRAFGSGKERAVAWEHAQTIADDLRVSETLGDGLTLRALRESGGVASAVGDVEMINGMKECGQREGLGVSPETGAAVHALRVLANEGRIGPRETVVVLNTGSATRYLDALG